MGDLVSLQTYKRIDTVEILCPFCKRKQEFTCSKEVSRISRKLIWYPISPFCCDIMRYADSDEWNAQLDSELEKVI